MWKRVLVECGMVVCESVFVAHNNTQFFFLKSIYNKHHFFSKFFLRIFLFFCFFFCFFVKVFFVNLINKIK